MWALSLTFEITSKMNFPNFCIIPFKAYMFRVPHRYSWSRLVFKLVDINPIEVEGPREEKIYFKGKVEKS